jgi:1,5-anhydro-D-fructose reductase (1,5-anhydro-D-mannitol-forming)
MINWLVIGIGDIATKRVIPAIQAEPRSRLAGIMTRHPQKGAAYPGARVWTSLDEALACRDIDAVYVASPVYRHVAQTIAALHACKDVLCEKPMALDLLEAEAMVSVAKITARTLGIAYYRRMYPKIRRAKELLEQGVIGLPVLAELKSHDWFNDEDGKRSWILDPKMSGGGPLYDIASHRIDLLNFFFGKPSRATGYLSNVVHERPVEDNATVLIDYESGVRGIVDVRWHSRVVRDEFRIIGTDGEINLTPLNGPELTYPGGSEQIPPPANLHYPCVENFVDAVLDGKHLFASGESSLDTDWVTEQVVRYHKLKKIPTKHAGK